jgi:ribulose bisphosphate carboxylase small subunit
LNFNFRQTVTTQVLYTLVESILEIIIIIPLAVVITTSMLNFLNTVQFYKNLAQLIQRRYFHAIEWQQILKYRTKFETIYKALDGIEQFKPILEEINKFLKVDFSNHTYEEVSEAKNKMQVLDAMLPNLDELDVSTSHKNEHEKVR